MKYRSDKSLRELTDMITLEVNSIDTLMKAKMTAYSQVKGQLQSLLRKQSGNVAVRSLNDIVKKENFLLESEYMMTVLVAVPNTALAPTTLYVPVTLSLTKIVVDTAHDAAAVGP